MQIIHIMRKGNPYNQAFCGCRHCTRHYLKQLYRLLLNIMDSFSRIFQTALQLAIVGSVWAVSEAVVRFTHLPVSSGVLGLFLMLALLGSGVIKTGMVERGAKWVLGELVFFFIPIMVSVLQYRDLLMSEGWQLVLTIVVGTALVMIITALTLNFCYRWKRRLHKKLHA